MDLNTPPALASQGHLNATNPPAETALGPGGLDDPKPAEERVAEVHLVACDPVELAVLSTAIEAFPARVASFTTPEAWFEQQARPYGDDEVADLVLVLGLPTTILQNGWISRARAAAPDSLIVAALVEATLGQVAAVVNQGAQGLLTNVGAPDSLQATLRELLETALRRQEQRREAVGHRRALASLTAAESDVLDLMLDGYANKQIAQRLSIGLRTVELRRSKIMRKMGAASVAQLISSVCVARSNT